jgi:hypothetical protein
MSLKSEFADWKTHPITKRVFEGLREQEQIQLEQLAVSAGVEPTDDRFKVGYIAALRDVYLIRLEDEEDTN